MAANLLRDHVSDTQFRSHFSTASPPGQGTRASSTADSEPHTGWAPTSLRIARYPCDDVNERQPENGVPLPVSDAGDVGMSDNARFRKGFLLALVVAITATFVLVIKDFLMTIFVAGIFSGLAHPLYLQLR